MRSTRRFVVLIAAVALVVAACGDDDASTTTSAATEATTGATTAATTASTTATPPPDGGSGDIGALQERYEMTPLRTTYLIGEEGDTTEIVLAQDPTANPPVESISLPEDSTKIIISEGSTIVCDASSSTCFEIPGGGGDSLATGLLGPLSTTLLSAGPGGIASAETTQEPITVAGRDGTCFTYTPPASAEADTDLLRQCIDNELGFTLLMQASEVGDDTISTVMELIAFAEPTADDFTPPYPVTATPQP